MPASKPITKWAGKVPLLVPSRLRYPPVYEKKGALAMSETSTKEVESEQSTETVLRVGGR